MAMLNKQGVLISGEENPLESIYQSSMIRRSPQDASIEFLSSTLHGFPGSALLWKGGKFMGRRWAYWDVEIFWKYGFCLIAIYWR